MAADDALHRPRSALGVPWGFGLLYGLLAAVVAALCTLAVVVVDWTGPDLPPRLGARTLRALYGAHGVATGGPPVAAGGRLPESAPALVPIAVLLAIGYAHARGYVGTSARQAVLAGASVAVGYAVAALAGVSLLGAPSAPLAAGVAFAGYALAFGALGGYFARSP